MYVLFSGDPLPDDPIERGKLMDTNEDTNNFKFEPQELADQKDKNQEKDTYIMPILGLFNLREVLQFAHAEFSKTKSPQEVEEIKTAIRNAWIKNYFPIINMNNENLPKWIFLLNKTLSSLPSIYQKRIWIVDTDMNRLTQESHQALINYLGTMDPLKITILCSNVILRGGLTTLGKMQAEQVSIDTLSRESY